MVIAVILIKNYLNETISPPQSVLSLLHFSESYW